MCWLINGNPFLMFLIVILFKANSISSSGMYACVNSICVSCAGCRRRVPWLTGCCPQRSRWLWSQRVWQSPRLTRKSCCCSTRTLSSAESTRRYSIALKPAHILHWPAFYCWCWQLHLVLSENQRRTVGVVWKLLQSCEEPSFEFNFSLLYNQGFLILISCFLIKKRKPRGGGN